MAALSDQPRFFRSLDPLPADRRLLARPCSKVAFVRQLRDYLHQVCHSLNLSTRIVPHQLRHYATVMLRAGVSFPVLMKLLGHTDPDMTMRYVEVALTDLQREFQPARSHPRHLVPQPKLPFPRLRTGLDGVIDSLPTTLLAVASIDSLTGSPRSPPKCANSTCNKNGQRLAGYVGYSEVTAQKLAGKVSFKPVLPKLEALMSGLNPSRKGSTP